MARFDPKAFVLGTCFRKWGRPCPFEEGYTLLLPSPMDMPFLLRFSLESLLGIDTANCKQILVVPDGWGDDRGTALRKVVESFEDPRIEMVDLRAFDYLVIRSMRPPRSAAIHWLMVVNGTRLARCEYAFLHDSDAFFLESDGLERQYRECRERGMDTLGVTARWDPFFTKLGYSIPGTWELMYSTRWARRYSPYELKGVRRETPHGTHEFDSMLYPQYLDFPKGKVGVMEQPPRLVHFNGTIVTYRIFHDRKGKPVVDELFRILLLSLLEELLPPKDGHRVTPPINELVSGLTDSTAKVTYGSETAIREYPIFRGMLDELCHSPIFEGSRAGRIHELVKPFDDHFLAIGSRLEKSDGVFRAHGLG